MRKDLDGVRLEEADVSCEDEACVEFEERETNEYDYE